MKKERKIEPNWVGFSINSTILSFSKSVSAHSFLPSLFLPFLLKLTCVCLSLSLSLFPSLCLGQYNISLSPRHSYKWLPLFLILWLSVVRSWSLCFTFYHWSLLCLFLYCLFVLSFSLSDPLVLNLLRITTCLVRVEVGLTHQTKKVEIRKLRIWKRIEKFVRILMSAKVEFLLENDSF